MTPLQERDARFWMRRLRPVERLVWVGRPRFTIRPDRSLLWAVGPATLFILLHFLFGNGGRGDARPGNILSNPGDHLVEWIMIAALAWCLFFLLRHGLIFPFEQRYAITDRRLMVWRHGRRPALVDEEIDLSLRLRRPARPRNSVVFARERLNARSAPLADMLPARVAGREVGFLNPNDPDGLEAALEAVLDGMEESAWR